MWGRTLISLHILCSNSLAHLKVRKRRADGQALQELQYVELQDSLHQARLDYALYFQTARDTDDGTKFLEAIVAISSEVESHMALVSSIKAVAESESRTGLSTNEKAQLVSSLDGVVRTATASQARRCDMKSFESFKNGLVSVSESIKRSDALDSPLPPLEAISSAEAVRVSQMRILRKEVANWMSEAGSLHLKCLQLYYIQAESALDACLRNWESVISDGASAEVGSQVIVQRLRVAILPWCGNQVVPPLSTKDQKALDAIVKMRGLEKQPAGTFDDSSLADGHFELLKEIEQQLEALNSRLRSYFVVAQIQSVTQIASKAPDLPVDVKFLQDLNNTVLKNENKYVVALPKVVEVLL